LAKLEVQELIEAGIHFGHPASRWNPKMKPYIFGKRNFIHIIDLKETVKGIVRAKKFLSRLVAAGGDVVFVGTKRQARVAAEQQAKRCGMPYVNHRWLGGTLTNFRSIRSRLGRLDELDQMEVTGTINRHSKKMIASLQREHQKIRRNLEGIRMMERLPAALIIVDTIREKNAVREARKMDVPVVAMADTEADPDDLTVVIPGNDDAMRAIEIVLTHLADAVIEGKANRATLAAKEGEGQAPARAPTRPRARASRRPTTGAERPVPEMPLPKPHPATQAERPAGEAVAGDTGTGGPAESAAGEEPASDAPSAGA
jgi:small subunit ribosomal protein S2